MNQKYKIGVIGLGARAETFAKQLATGAHARAEFFGLCDIDEDRMAKFCDYCEIAGGYRFTNSQEFLTHPGLDAVVITTPEFTHKEIAVAAMRAGKHIYLEKAMAANSEDCREIIRAHQQSGVVAYLGFNMRQVNFFQHIKGIVDSGVLGELLHVYGLEQLSVPHSASFMRRYHRHSRRSGGLLNTKCAHDLDYMQWLVGHEHKVIKVASFGGTNVFVPGKAPKGHGQYCHSCPENIVAQCPYKDQAGFVFPVTGKEPIHKTRQTEVYGGDLCVYSDDKDLVDNQTVIFEWDHGVRGTFNLQLFQNRGLRKLQVWGEKGTLEGNTADHQVRITMSHSGEQINQEVRNVPGGHGGSDTRMLALLLDAIEKGEQPTSNLAAGLAATLLAEKADQSRLTGRVVEISPIEYMD